jgi:hypothetical protein
VTAQWNHIERRVYKKVSTYLIVTCDELTHSMTQAFTREHCWFLKPHNYTIKTPLLFQLSLLCLRISQDLSRNRPVVHFYSSFFASFLVDFVVLTYMLATRGIAANMEHFMLAVFIHEVRIFPLDIGKSLGNEHASLIMDTDLHMLHHRPSTKSTTPLLMNFTITFAVKSSCKSFAMSFLLMILTPTGTLCRSSRPSFCVR